MLEFTPEERETLIQVQALMNKPGWESRSRFICDNAIMVMDTADQDGATASQDLRWKINQRLGGHFSADGWVTENVAEARGMKYRDWDRFCEQMRAWRQRWLAAMIQGQA